MEKGSRIAWSVWPNNGNATTVEEYGSLGIQVNAEGKDLFDAAWEHVYLVFVYSDRPPTVHTHELPKKSFRDCYQLTSEEIKAWLVEHGIVVWPKGRPPKVIVQHLAAQTFALVDLKQNLAD